MYDYDLILGTLFAIPLGYMFYKIVRLSLPIQFFNKHFNKKGMEIIQ